MTFFVIESVTTNIVVQAQIIHQIKDLNSVGCEISHEFDKDCKNKLNKCLWNDKSDL